MQIAIIGAGKVGSALAQHWVASGHQVILGLRDLQSGDKQSLLKSTGASAALPGEAVAGAGVVVLALPWKVAEAAIAGLGDLAGKIVIDCMNPLMMGPNGLALDRGHTTSGGETVQAWLPHARVVKTLNQVGAEVMADTSRFSPPPVMFMAGNDPEAKATVAALLADLGFEPLDAGDLTKSRILEPFGLVWINQAMVRGKGRDWAFAAMQRNGGGAR